MSIDPTSLPARHFRALDTNGDGILQGGTELRAKGFDQNGDNKITLDEFAATLSNNPVSVQLARADQALPIYEKAAAASATAQAKLAKVRKPFNIATAIGVGVTTATAVTLVAAAAVPLFWPVAIFAALFLAAYAIFLAPADRANDKASEAKAAAAATHRAAIESMPIRNPPPQTTQAALTPPSSAA
jgi:hypothetical protein